MARDLLQTVRPQVEHLPPTQWIPVHPAILRLRQCLIASALLIGFATAQADTTRASLLEMPGGVPFTAERVRGWVPLVAEFGPKVFNAWEQGLYAAAIGQHAQARQWLLKAARQGNTPEKQRLCLAYKLARGTESQNNDDPIGEAAKARAAEQQIMDWAGVAYAKQARKQKLSAEEQAAWAGVESLPDDDEESRKVSRQRLIVCRNLTSAPDPKKLFDAALKVGRPLPGYALNYLAAQTETEGRFADALRLYSQALSAGFAPAGLNLVRLEERTRSPQPADRAWERIIVGYRQHAELGDGRAMIYLADLMERGSSGPTNTDIAILLYQQGLDAGNNKLELNEGMSYVLLALHAQERLTEYYRQGRLKLDSAEERRRYLSMALNLEEVFTQKPASPSQEAKP